MTTLELWELDFYIPRNQTYWKANWGLTRKKPCAHHDRIHRSSRSNRECILPGQLIIVVGADSCPGRRSQHRGLSCFWEGGVKGRDRRQGEKMVVKDLISLKGIDKRPALLLAMSSRGSASQVSPTPECSCCAALTHVPRRPVNLFISYHTCTTCGTRILLAFTTKPRNHLPCPAVSQTPHPTQKYGMYTTLPQDRRLPIPPFIIIPIPSPYRIEPPHYHPHRPP